MNAGRSKLRITVVTMTLVAVIAGGIVTWQQMERQSRTESGLRKENVTSDSGNIGDTKGSDALQAERDIVTVTPSARETSGEAEGTFTVPESTPTTEPVQEENPTENESEAAENTQNEGNPSEESSETSAVVDSVELNFTEATVLESPVAGTVLIPYDMENTVYFQTLDQYKCNPGVVLSAELGAPVKAVANSQVLTVEEDPQTGTTITMDMGNGYQAVYGQLAEVTLLAGQQVEAGTVIGTIAEPTKYYNREGSNLFFQLTKDGQTLDPSMYLPPAAE